MKGLPLVVKTSIAKARDSAMLAVEIYNKPGISFKTGGYVVMMIIAWTSLFHAYFYKCGIKPIHKRSPRRYAKIDGDYKYWELSTCLKEYFKDSSQTDAVAKNLDFFIKLRNRIEHRSLPEIDADLFGEAQAMLLNFNDYLENIFGKKHAIRAALSFSLQMYPEPKGIKELFKSKTEDIVSFIKEYRSSLTADIANSGRYTFRAILIQVGNHASGNALPIQFVKYDDLTEEQRKELGRFPVLQKEKIIPIANINTYKPNQVVRLVRERLEKLGHSKIAQAFNTNRHTDFWKRHQVRPVLPTQDPEKTRSDYCVYDRAHCDYLYLQPWINLIVKELMDSGVGP